MFCSVLERTMWDLTVFFVSLSNFVLMNGGLFPVKLFLAMASVSVPCLIFYKDLGFYCSFSDGILSEK